MGHQPRATTQGTKGYYDIPGYLVGIKAQDTVTPLTRTPAVLVTFLLADFAPS